MHIVFIRHTESEKNVNNQFSSYKDKEPLTEIGMSQSENLGNDLLEFKERKNLTCKNVYAASSTRAIETAKIIASSAILRHVVESKTAGSGLL